MKRKDYLKHFVSLLVVVAFIVFAVASSESEGEKTESGINLNFEQIGYYKGENKLRYFTFYVNSSETLNPDSISEDVFEALKKHGSKQMNTSGQITASFYYIDKSSVPDITTLDAQKANDIAHERKPIASVWIMPTGQINLIYNPE